MSESSKRASSSDAQGTLEQYPSGKKKGLNAYDARNSNRERFIEARTAQGRRS